ncbi:MAG: hypothetical protein JNM82_15515 [Rhodocyclaceae bacterium]|nr:hypothetical protein [Rhodocyclaceae bacterium]
MAAGLGKCWCAELPPFLEPDHRVPGCYCPDCLRQLSTTAAGGHSSGV